MSWDAVMGWVAETGLMISALVVLVLLLRRPVARIFGARWAYALWALPVLRLVMPEVTLPRLFSLEQKEAEVMPILFTEYAAVPISTSAQQSSVDWLAYLGPTLGVLWIMGAGLYLCRALITHKGQARRLSAASTHAPQTVQCLSKRVAKQMGLKACPPVMMGQVDTGPLVCHVTRPTIYLPRDFETDFTPRQQSLALLHEMAHIKRKDLWAAWAWLLFRAVNWPNPLVHFANRAFRADQEAACDQTVLGLVGGGHTHRATYAETLLRAACLAARPERASSVSGELALTIHQPLKERLTMLQSTSKKSGLLSRIGAAALIASAFAMTAPLSFAGPDDEMAGKHEKHIKKSVIKTVKIENGKEVTKHIEVTVDGDNVMAYEIDEDGNKTQIDPKDVHHMDIGMMEGENVFVLDTDKHPKGMMKKRVIKRMGEDGEVDVKVIIDSDEEFTFTDKDGNVHDLKTMRPPHAPGAPDAPHVMMFKHKGAMHGDMRLRTASSLLEAAEGMIDEAEVDKGQVRKIEKAKRAIEKARKALKEAEEAMAEE